MIDKAFVCPCCKININTIPFKKEEFNFKEDKYSIEYASCHFCKKTFIAYVLPNNEIITIKKESFDNFKFKNFNFPTTVFYFNSKKINEEMFFKNIKKGKTPIFIIMPKNCEIKEKIFYFNLDFYEIEDAVSMVFDNYNFENIFIEKQIVRYFDSCNLFSYNETILSNFIRMI